MTPERPGSPLLGNRAWDSSFPGRGVGKAQATQGHQGTGAVMAAAAPPRETFRLLSGPRSRGGEGAAPASVGSPGRGSKARSHRAPLSEAHRPAVGGCSGATGWCPRQGFSARSPASARSLGCSELCLRALGVSGDAPHPALREQPRLQNVVHQKKTQNQTGFLLGTGCPLEGSLRHGTKQNAAASRPPRPLRGAGVRRAGGPAPCGCTAALRPPRAAGPLTERSPRPRPAQPPAWPICADHHRTEEVPPRD